MKEHRRSIEFIAILTLVMSFSLTTQSLSVTLFEKPYTFKSAEPALATQVNINFDTLYNKVSLIDSALRINESSRNIAAPLTIEKQNLSGGEFITFYNSEDKTDKGYIGLHNSAFTIRSENTTPLHIQQANQIRMSFVDGKVAIGTTTSSSTLEIYGKGDKATLLKLCTERPWEFRQLGVGAHAGLDLHSTFDSKFFQITGADEVICLRVTALTKKRTVELVPQGGYVYIGSNEYAINTILDVRGAIYHHGSQLYADYVFDSDYKLES